MAETYLIAHPQKALKGEKIYRVTKDRAWDDLPFSYNIDVRCVNYSHGKNVVSWRVKEKFNERGDAILKFNKLTGCKLPV